MARRISLFDLEALCETINHKFGKDSNRNDGDTSIVGVFYISQANGGVNLCRVTEQSCSSDPITSGHKTKRELYGQMLGFIRLSDLLENQQEK